MLHIGCHLSCSKGYANMGREALSIGADTFQFFTRNPRGGSVKPFDQSDADALNAFMQEHAFAPILAHAPYTLNACAAEEKYQGLRQTHHARGFRASEAYSKRDAQLPSRQPCQAGGGARH